MTGRTLMTGWGRTAPTSADLAEPVDSAGVRRLLAAPGPRGVIPRGLGRSYGDAAQNAGGTVVELTGLDRVHAFDAATRQVRVDAGISLDALMRTFVPLGMFPAVTPGTRYVTVGGAIAADIHGKNHHVDGSFCNHVPSFTLEAPAATLAVSPDESPEVFWATAGGMGLTGVVTEATLELEAIPSSHIRQDTERADDLDDLMARMEARDHEYRYSVAWIDCVATGRHMGRSVLTRGDWAEVGELPENERRDPLAYSASVRVEAPPWFPNGLLNRLTVAAFNEMWFRKAPRNEVGAIVPLTEFFHPLDMVGGWNRVYGSRGFLQYQFVVPFGPDGERALRTSLERLAAAGAPSFLAVLKRFGPGNPAPLSFPMPGWTLALDIPATVAGLAELLDDLDAVVLDAGGRLYLAKDSRAKPWTIAAMYPQLASWREVRAKLDPQGLLCSDMSRRLELA